MLAPVLLPAERRARPVRPQLPQQLGARERPRIPGQIGAERVHQLRRARPRDPEQLLDVATREQLPVQGLQLPDGVRDGQQPLRPSGHRARLSSPAIAAPGAGWGGGRACSVLFTG